MVKCTGAASTAIALVSVLGLVACGSGVRNAAPRIATVPSQVSPGGGAFSLDLSSYVSDRENDPLVYSVVSGGGSFSGAMYSHTFATIGNYPVTFQVSDTEGKASTGSFVVFITSANFAALSEGDDLVLLDTDTQSMLTVAGAPGSVDTLRGTMASGHVIYERAAGTTQLYVYDPSTRATATLGNSNDENTVFAGHGGNLVAFTKTKVTTPTDDDLFVWDVVTGTVTEVSAAAGVPEGNAFPLSTGVVYFERGAPADIWRYDPATNTSTVLADATTNEAIQAVLGDGTLLFGRVGAGGETDLHRWSSATGLVELGVDVTALLSQSKTYRGATSDGKIVFEATGSGSVDLYLWDPATGTTTVIGNTSVDEELAAITVNDEVVVKVATTVTNDDLVVYTHGALTPLRVVANDGANEVYAGQTPDGDLVFTRQGTPHSLHLFITSTSGAVVLASGGSDNHVFEAALSNHNVVYSKSGGSGGVFVVNTQGAPVATAVAGPIAAFAGATSGGDFVVQATVASQTDLILWDDSEAAAVTISDAAGDDAFGAGLADGRILFTRVVPGKTTSDLFAWEPTSGASSQLTNGTRSHAVLTTFAASNP